MSSTPESKPKKTRSSRPRQAEQVVARNLAVVSIYRKLIGMALVATLAAVISVVAAVSLAAKRVPPQFVPVLPDGRILPLIPLDKPNMSDAKVAAFALDAVHALNTYDYINWRDQLNSAQQYFSQAAWKAYDEQIAITKTLKAVEARRMISSVQPTGNSQITYSAKADMGGSGVYVWKVEVPVVVRYTSHEGNEGGNTVQGKAILTISRVPTTVQPLGVAIQNYRLEQAQ